MFPAIDIAAVVQGVMVAVLAACAGTLWRTSNTISALNADFRAHKDEDDKRFTKIDEDIREVRATAVARRKR